MFGSFSNLRIGRGGKISMSIPRVYIFLLLSFLSFRALNAQSDKLSPFHKLDNIRKFGDFLFCQGDYLRSFYEYGNYLKKENNDTLRFKIALAFQRMKRFDEASVYFADMFFNSDFENESRNEYFKTLFLAERFSEIEKYSKDNFYLPTDTLNVPKKLAVTAFLFGDLLPDSSEFVRLFPSRRYAKMLDFYKRRKNLTVKNPYIAAGLSAFVPGLGKIYTENYGDGVTAFIFTSLLGYITYDNFRAGHSFRGWVFAGLTAWIYAGNVYGSFASAQIFNAKLRFDFKEEVKRFLEKVNYFLPSYKFLCTQEYGK